MPVIIKSVLAMMSGLPPTLLALSSSVARSALQTGAKAPRRKAKNFTRQRKVWKPRSAMLSLRRVVLPV